MKQKSVKSENNLNPDKELKQKIVSLTEENSKLSNDLIDIQKHLNLLCKGQSKKAAAFVIANKKLVSEAILKANMLAEIVELKDAQLFIEKQRFEKTLLSIGDGVISTDIHLNVLFMNKVAEDLTAWSKQDALGQPIYTVLNIISENSRVRDENIIDKVIKSKAIHNLKNHTILIDKNGSEKLIEDSAAPIFDVKGNVIGVVLVFRDYTEKWERLKKIEYFSFHDQLTGLYNRRFFEEELKRLDVKRNMPITVIMGDVNGLKLLNDSFGHSIGDKLLVKVANTIVKSCREDEIVSRIGGDEFAILIANCDKEKARSILKRISNNLSKQTVNKIEISVSFGFECKTDSNQNIKKILIQAENSLYQQKVHESTSSRNKTVQLICTTLFEKNKREGIHSQKVSNLAGEFAEYLGLNKDEISTIKLIGLMHDIGKIGIEDSILNKPDLLSDNEYLEIKKHPEIGHRILSSVTEFEPIAMAVLQHHERWDGKGYPLGLKGKDILDVARIISLVDSFSAMTLARTYRKCLSIEEALNEIKACSGTQFDPIFSQSFIDMINQNLNHNKTKSPI